MKFKVYFPLAAAFFVFFYVAVSFGADPQTQGSPSTFLPNDRYEFGPVVEGTQISHEFLIQNKGTAPLQIERVQTS